MDVTPLVWWVTIGAATVALLLDVAVVARRPHVPSMRECTTYLVVYVSLALLFGLFIWWDFGGQYAGEFYAGWLTEYSLSVDNLFVFLLIMANFRVPERLQQSALMVGIIIAIVLRGLFIALGAAVINSYAWVFYIAFHGTKLIVREGSKRLVTPMFIVILALGTTDLLFALDSIPAIYGLTKEPYLVLTANIFALMGLRQLYFLIGGLLKRLVYLSIGLAVLLAFIGVKLILHALHENNLPFINGGQPLHGIPDIPISVSLGAIVLILGVTTIASLVKSSRDRKAAERTAGQAISDPTEDDHPDW